MSRKKATTAAPAPELDAGLSAFAHHFAEVLRIARTHDAIPSRFYNDLADAWCNFENTVKDTQLLHDSEGQILAMLRWHAAQREGGE